MDRIDTPVTMDSLLTWMTGRVAHHAQLAPAEIDPELPFTEFGLDSVGALSVLAEIEATYGVYFDGDAMWEYPTTAALATALQGRIEAAVTAQ